jgi:hypothetical protein
MNHDIDGKLDRNELDSLRDYMDKQLKKLKKLAVCFIDRSDQMHKEKNDSIQFVLFIHLFVVCMCLFHVS